VHTRRIKVLQTGLISSKETTKRDYMNTQIEMKLEETERLDRILAKLDLVDENLAKIQGLLAVQSDLLSTEDAPLLSERERVNKL
jgi:hypothetical protein